MVPEQIYRRQVGPVQPQQAVMTDASSFGAGVAAQASQAIEGFSRERLEDLELERRHSAAEQASGFGRGYASAREDFSEITRTARLTAGAGHADAIRAQWEQLRPALLDGITEEDVRRRASEAFDDYGSRLFMAESEFEDVRRVENVLSDWSATQTIAGNRIRRLETTDEFLAEMQIQYDFIRGMEDLSGPQKVELERQWGKTGTIAYLRGVIDRDPALARAMLTDAAGLFDDVLEAGEVEVLLNGADTEVRALEVRARQEQAQVTAQVRETARLALNRHQGGIAIADDEWAELIVQAEAVGDVGLAEDLRQGAADSTFTRRYEGAPPLLLQQDLARLAGQGSRNESEERQLGWLRDNIGTRESQFDRDPAGFVMAFGGAPALDPEDPASFQRRAEWARAASNANGRYIPPLTEAEAEPFRDMLARDGDLAVLAQLDNFTDPFARVDAAQAIDPGNHLLHRLAVMRPALRGEVRNGQAALTANPQLLAIEDAERLEFRETARTRLAQALRLIDVEDRAAILDAADALTAHWLSRNPTANLDSVSEAFFLEQINRALGGTRIANSEGQQVQRGGVVLYPGGTALFLAEDLTAAQWGEAVRRDLAQKRASGAGPINPDGSPLALNAQVIPVWMGGNMYAWQDRLGRPVLDANGDNYVSTVARPGAQSLSNFRSNARAAGGQ